MAESMSPLLNRRTTLKDALSMLLDASVQAGIVVDRSGRAQGFVTADSIAEFMQGSARPAGPIPGAPSTTPADAAAEA
jgi:CBS domain-containing protein